MACENSPLLLLRLEHQLSSQGQLFYRTKLFGDWPTIIMERRGVGVDEGKEGIKKSNGAKVRQDMKYGRKRANKGEEKVR